MKAVKKPIMVDFYPIQDIKKDIPLIKLWVEGFDQEWEDNFALTLQNHLRVVTLEGISYAVTDKDVIIRGPFGEYYPCKKDIFQDTYEIVP